LGNYGINHNGVDGDFGEATLEAVNAFKTKYKLGNTGKNEGVVGDTTIKYLQDAVDKLLAQGYIYPGSSSQQQSAEKGLNVVATKKSGDITGTNNNTPIKQGTTASNSGSGTSTPQGAGKSEIRSVDMKEYNSKVWTNWVKNHENGKGLTMSEYWAVYQLYEAGFRESDFASYSDYEKVVWLADIEVYEKKFVMTPEEFLMIVFGVIADNNIKINGTYSKTESGGVRYRKGYTGGRSSSEYESLASDPAHNGKVTGQGIKERNIGVDLEGQGKLKGITRDPSGAAEFIDANGVKWDIKSFNSNFKPSQGGFKLDRDLGKIEAELGKGENVIIDTTNMSAADANALRQSVNSKGWNGKILWWP
jgi:peptidoglycan hydrolase-like protein with peptidoglycan-binding domain